MPLATVLDVLASLVAHRVPVDLDKLYPDRPIRCDVSDAELVPQANALEIVIEPGTPPLQLAELPQRLSCVHSHAVASFPDAADAPITGNRACSGQCP